MDVFLLAVPAEIDLDFRADHVVRRRRSAVRTVQPRDALAVLDEVHIVDGVLTLDIEVNFAPSGPDNVARNAAVDPEIDLDLVGPVTPQTWRLPMFSQMASRSKAGA